MTLAADSLIEASDLNTQQDARRTQLNGVLSGGYKTWTFHKRAYDLSSTTDIAERSMEIIPSDDWELLMFGVAGNGTSSSTTFSATLETPDDIDNTFLLGQIVTAEVASTGAAYQTARTAYTATTGRRLWLLRGVKYRISIASTDASPPSGSWVEATVACKSRLRER